MWNTVGPLSKPDYNRFHLQHWVTSANPFAPLIIVIPGFLTEQNPAQPFVEWSDPIIQFAKKHKLSAAGLYWPSGKLSDFFDNENLIDYAGKNILTMGSKALKVWEKAVNGAEQAGRNFREWLPQGPRPIILLGHSLGARLALITAENVPTGRLSGVITFAAAYESRLCNYSHLDRGVRHPPLIAYSSNDSVLKTLFIAGQNPEIILVGAAGYLLGEIGIPAALAKYAFDRKHDEALGYAGPPKRHRGMCTPWNVSSFDHQSIGHSDYIKLMPKLLNDYKVMKLRCFFREVLLRII